jgi:hypothetical protein
MTIYTDVMDVASLDFLASLCLRRTHRMLSLLPFVSGTHYLSG